MLTPPKTKGVTPQTGDSYWAATIFRFKKCRDRSTPLSLVILASEVMIWSIRWIMSLWISSRNLAGFPPDDVVIVVGGESFPKNWCTRKDLTPVELFGDRCLGGFWLSTFFSDVFCLGVILFLRCKLTWSNYHNWAKKHKHGGNKNWQPLHKHKCSRPSTIEVL